ncbi:PocR ligand-binding domain-containing protein [Vagococcus hydrophili]|nr:PocR ligand-binding domain-containing protein [Vagococcus hydrophili]
MLKIDELINMKEWEKLQDSIADVTKLAIILVDYKGQPVGKHSNIQPFCSKLRSNPDLAKYCEKCDARGAIEAVRQGEPFIYRCHFNLVDTAIPIIMNEQYLGAIMAGQVKLDTSNSDLEQLLTLNEVNQYLEDYLTDYEKIPNLDLIELTKSANMLSILSHYLLTEITKSDYSVVSKDNHLVVKENLIHSYQTKEHKLQPIIDLLFENKQIMYTLNQLSEINHISLSYLSRLLKKEFGEPFNKFYPRLKIEWAKDLLQHTDKNITEISDSLGFLDTSYFIRSFKKFEGISPLKYKKTTIEC